MSKTATAAEPQYVAETLAWCNERRAENGEQPLMTLPKGRRGDPTSCPCGTATGLNVLPHSYWDASAFTKLGDLPAVVSKFVDAFDAGDLPQYEAKS